jgi:5-methylthioadenosine/S-adenosylhomocysteine deaminase
VTSSATAAPRPVDLVVTHGTLVTIDPKHRVIKDGALAIDKGAIVAVGTASEVAAAYKGRDTIALAGDLVIPGLVNAHTHAPMVLFRGIADDKDLMDWLRNYIFPAEARNVTPEFVRAGMRLAALEMIRSGTTTFFDMYYFEDAVAEVVKQAGMRAVLAATLIEIEAPDGKTVADQARAAEAFLTRWQGDPLITPAVGPHSPYLCGPDTLRIARELADRHKAPVLIHLSESPFEQKIVAERYHKTSTELLRDAALLRKGLVGNHGVWLSPEDRKLLLDAGAGVAHCPQSNMKLASGAAPVNAMMNEGVRLGLGTDGAASNNDLDMFEEMATAALLGKHSTGDPKATPAAKVLEMATLGGARAIGMEDRFGSLETGKRADVTIVGIDAFRMHPLFDPISHLVYAAKGADVRHVIIDGRVVMRDRKVLTLDADAAVAEADRMRQQVVRTLGERSQ